MKRNIFKVFIVYTFIAFTLITVHAIRTSNHDIKIKKIELRNTDAQLKNLQLDFDKLNKDLDSELQNKVKNQQKIDELEKHRIELEKQLQAKKEAASRFASTVTGTKKVYALPSINEKAFIYQRESGNCHTRWQGEHGACPPFHGTPTNPNTGYGLCQATPGWKMATAGPDWATSYETQDKWCTQYAHDRYGSWSKAYQFWINNKWW